MIKELHLDRRDSNTWEYCGKRIQVSPSWFWISCPKGLKSLDTVSIPKGSPPDRRLTAEELQSYRSVLGVLLYLATWVRWDSLVAASLCSQRTTKATVADARALNKISRQTASRPDLGIRIRRGVVDISNCMILAWADSAFANAEDEKFQCGVCVGLAPKGETNLHLTGNLTMILPISGYSGTVKRTVRSTLAAEAYAVSEGVEAAQFLRHVLLELLQDPRQPGSTLQRVEKVRWTIPIVCCTDSDNLDKSINSDSESVKDKTAAHLWCCSRSGRQRKQQR